MQAEQPVSARRRGQRPAGHDRRFRSCSGHPQGTILVVSRRPEVPECRFSPSPMSETPDRPIASGNVAEVFARGSRILKLYKQVEGKAAAFREAALHAAVEAMGLPVPALWGVEQVGDRWGVIFDRVEGSSFADRIRNEPEVAPGYLDLLVRLQLDIHSQPGVAFPTSSGGWPPKSRGHQTSARLAAGACWPSRPI